jgi:uncharacterized membrane protein YhaH (DUF805 family)
MIAAWRHAVFHNYAEFNGRMHRAEFWWFYLFQSIVSWSPIILVGIFSGGDTNHSFPFENAIAVLWFLFLIATFLPELAAHVRRLHDAGFSGWWVLPAYIPFINIIGFIPVLILLALPSKASGSRFGDYHDSGAPG